MSTWVLVGLQPSTPGVIYLEETERGRQKVERVTQLKRFVKYKNINQITNNFSSAP